MGLNCSCQSLKSRGSLNDVTAHWQEIKPFLLQSSILRNLNVKAESLGEYRSFKNGLRSLLVMHRESVKLSWLKQLAYWDPPTPGLQLAWSLWEVRSERWTFFLYVCQSYVQLSKMGEGVGGSSGIEWLGSTPKVRCMNAVEVCICVCYMLQWVWICVGICEVCACARRSQIQESDVSFSMTLHLKLWCRVSHWPWSSTIRLNWLATEL